MADRLKLTCPTRAGLTLGDLYQWVQDAHARGVDPRVRVRTTVGFKQQILQVFVRVDDLGREAGS